MFTGMSRRKRIDLYLPLPSSLKPEGTYDFFSASEIAAIMKGTIVFPLCFGPILHFLQNLSWLHISRSAKAAVVGFEIAPQFLTLETSLSLHFKGRGSFLGGGGGRGKPQNAPDTLFPKKKLGFFFFFNFPHCAVSDRYLSTVVVKPCHRLTAGP